MLEEKVGSKQEITLNNGEKVTLVVYHLNPLVVGVEGLEDEIEWTDREKYLKKIYSQFPEKLKTIFPEEHFHLLSVEDILNKEEIEEENKKYNTYIKPSPFPNLFQLDYFKDKENRKYFDFEWYWLENLADSGEACRVFGDDGYVSEYSYIPICYVRPAFYFNNP